MAANADDASFDSVTPRPAATPGSTRSSGTVSDVFVFPVSRLSTGASVGGGSVNKSVSLLHVEDILAAPVGLVPKPPGLALSPIAP
jgi:hypothetical protein